MVRSRDALRRVSWVSEGSGPAWHLCEEAQELTIADHIGEVGGARLFGMPQQRRHRAHRGLCSGTGSEWVAEVEVVGT